MHIKGSICERKASREIQFHDTRLMRYNELMKRECDTSLLRSTIRYLECEIDDDDDNDDDDSSMSTLAQVDVAFEPDKQSARLVYCGGIILIKF